MPNLYDITSDMQGLLQMVEDGDLPAEAIADTLEGMEGLLDDKIEKCCHVIKNLEAEAGFLKEEADRLGARKRSREADIKRIKEAMLMTLTKLDRPSVKTAAFTVSATKGRPTAVIDNEEALPRVYVEQQVVTKVDKKSVLESLQAGNEVPGASLGVTATSLRIR